MENLPEEVMVDILSRLPVTTIIHCKCVCKKWHNLVNNSYFINLHLSRSPAGFMAQHDAEIPDGDTSQILEWVEIEDGLNHHSLHHEPVLNFDLNGYLPAPIPGTEFFPVGSVNGLICVWHRGAGNIHICNPITREYLTLPWQQNYKGALLVYKFGVNSLTGEYKVLRIFQVGLPGGGWSPVQEAEIYTLGTSQWRSLDHVPHRFGGIYTPFLNGYFHWKVYEPDVPESILTFDLDKETFQLFPSPPTEPQADFFSNLGVFKGFLCKSYAYDSQFTTWVMKQYGIKESWHKELVITQAIFAGLDWGMIFYVFLGLQDGTILVVLGNKMVAYCPKSKTIEDLAILGRLPILLTHHPSFIKLQDIDSERVHTF